MGCAKPHATHWQDLRSRPSSVVAAQPGVIISETGSAFELSFLADRYRVDLDAERIDALGRHTDPILSDAFQIVLLNYLLAPHGGSLSGDLISEKELPGGATFFRGPHSLPVAEIVAQYGSDLAGFEARGRALGGENRPLGDSAMRFLPFPSMPVTYILWQADDEFPASMSALMDRSISRWFTLDSIFIMALELSRRLVAPPWDPGLR